jgi:hypothetical protein
MFDKDALADFMDITSCDELTMSYQDIIKDMDTAADIIFSRQ